MLLEQIRSSIKKLYCLLVVIATFRHLSQDLGWIQYALEHQSPILGGLTLGAVLLWRGISAGRDDPSFDDLYRKFLVGLIALVLLLVLRSFVTEASEVVASTGYYILGFFSVLCWSTCRRSRNGT